MVGTEDSVAVGADEDVEIEGYSESFFEGSSEGIELIVGPNWNAGGGFQSLLNGTAKGFPLGISEGETEE